MITGASSGIGLELARILADHGYDIVAVSRNRQRLMEATEKLETQSKVKIIPMIKDLTAPVAPGEIYDRLKQEGIEIEILVNNAGFGAFGNFHEVGLQTHLDMIQVNITAMTHLTWLFHKDMTSRRHGRILNVASTAAFQPGPLMAVYYASKAYVLSFSEAIAKEVEGTGVTVTALCPGSTLTRFQEVARIEETRLIRAISSLDAAAVAKAGFEGMMKGRRVVIPGSVNKIQTKLVSLVPRGVLLAVVKWIQRGRRSKRQ